MLVLRDLYVMVAVASELLVLVVFIIVWSGGVCSSTAALVLACMVGIRRLTSAYLNTR